MNLSRISNETTLGKLVRAPLKLMPRGARVRVLQGTLRGKRWIVGSGTHGCWLGTYEYDKVRVFERCVRPGDVVYDVGAHVGNYTLLASELVGPAGRVFAFEPLPRNLRFLREHVRLNKAANVTIVDAAVAGREGKAFMSKGASSSEGRLGPAGEIEVRTVGLDELVSEGLPAPKCIKMDIEGGELDALEGASGILADAKPVVFLSTHGPQVHEPCRSLLAAAGYELRELGSPDELLATPVDAGQPADERMRQDWDERAQHDAFQYVLTKEGEWTEPEFFASGERDYETLVAPTFERMAFDPKGKAMLELGCGVGRMTRVFAARFDRVIGIDVSPEMLRRAEALNPEAGNIEWLLGNGTDLASVESASMDFSFSYLTLQHVPSSETVLVLIREMLRVLRPGGAFLFQCLGTRFHGLNWKGRMLVRVLERLQKPVAGVDMQGLGRWVSRVTGNDELAAGSTWWGAVMRVPEVERAVSRAGGALGGVTGIGEVHTWFFGRKSAV